MRYFGVAAVVLMVAAACAEQSNPPPEGEPDDTADSGSGGSSDSGGKASTTSGGSLPKSGTSSGGKASGGSNTGGDENLGGEASSIGGSANAGTAGKTSGGTGGTTGTAGTGGKATGGTGGKASGGTGGTASGGTTGTAGTSGSGGACTSSPNGPIQGLSARYESEIKGATGTGIGSKLIIANAGPSTLNLADLKLRYYLTNEVTAAINKTINWAWYRPNGGGNQVDKKSKVSFNVVPMPCAGSNANAYFEFTFTADAGLLEAGYQIYFSWTANNGASQNFTQSNDYSFDSNAVDLRKSFIYRAKLVHLRRILTVDRSTSGKCRTFARLLWRARHGLRHRHTLLEKAFQD